MSRILHVESGDGSAAGYVLDIRTSSPCAFHAQVRSPDETVLMVSVGATIDGPRGLLESVTSYFDANRMLDIGKQLVELARLELAQDGRPARAPNVGLAVCDVIVEAVATLGDAIPKLDEDQVAVMAARVSVELVRRFRIEERT